MKLDEALVRLREGQKIRDISWPKDEYLFSQDKNIFKTYKDTIFYYGTASLNWKAIVDSEWEIFE